LKSFENCKKLKTNKWQIFIPKNQVSSVYNRIINKIEIENLDDFRLMTTTLEDVYIQMGGGSSTDEFHAS
jgi:hypothetical protein